MNYRLWAIVLIVAHAGLAYAQTDSPLRLSLRADDFDSVYAPPETIKDDRAINAGGVNINLKVTAFTDYFFRGIDRSESGGGEDSTNLQFDGALRFDLGKFPDLFLGVFTNIHNSDPISRFEEIRPYMGLEVTARPLILSAGNTFYIFPDRDEFNTAEVFVKLQLDDSYFYRTRDPIFSPYLLAAWDYDKNNGLYMEFGVRHDFQIEGTPLTLSPMADIAYVSGHAAFRNGGRTGNDPSFDEGTTGPDSGLQHYDIGLEVTFAMNEVLNLPARLGKLDLKAYLFYTDGIDNDLRADTNLYGGIGIGFSY